MGYFIYVRSFMDRNQRVLPHQEVSKFCSVDVLWAVFIEETALIDDGRGVVATLKFAYLSLLSLKFAYLDFSLRFLPQ